MRNSVRNARPTTPDYPDTHPRIWIDLSDARHMCRASVKFCLSSSNYNYHAAGVPVSRVQGGGIARTKLKFYCAGRRHLVSTTGTFVQPEAPNWGPKKK